jgi:uncharacterized membrane protein
MKTYSHSIRTDLSTQRLWAVFSDLENWPTWDTELERTQWVDRERKIFSLKPKGGGAVKIRVSAFEEGKLWTDRASFPLAVLEGEHQFVALPDGGTELRTSMTIKGPLAFLWDRLVVKGIAAGVPAQTKALIQHARSATIAA